MGVGVLPLCLGWFCCSIEAGTTQEEGGFFPAASSCTVVMLQQTRKGNQFLASLFTGILHVTGE